MIATSKHTVCVQTLLDLTHVTAKLAIDLTDVFVQVQCSLYNTESNDFPLVLIFVYLFNLTPYRH